MRQSSISYFADMLLCPLLAAGLAIFASARFAKLALVEWSVMVIAGVVLWTRSGSRTATLRWMACRVMRAPSWVITLTRGASLALRVLERRSL
jgi:hypothetical protein